ncbi:immune inhibitor A domain-containing protein [Nocardioides donggukensis]|uniref:Immune inhibitor A n=1 Tax=Nocardioides donggukensis TaxID=2774019 RepID=A0A927K4I0_9ACTN|nr:immune inhibitor A domain-containing protein [Nocardioides donggukensis]MBD8870079.1 immune inhibitor A [Nocardioides donggukensis]
MTSTWFSGRRLRAAVAVPSLALAAATLASTGVSGGASAAPGTAPAGPTGASATSADAQQDGYINYVAPRADRQESDDAKIDKRTGTTERPSTDPLAQAYEVDAKHAQGNPVAARQLAKLEAKAIRTGKSPKELKDSGKQDKGAKKFKQAKETQTAQLLTILVEFNDQADDDFTGVKVPASVFGSRECVDGTVQNGPLHNNIPDPADYDLEDNNSMWVEDFSSEHFNDMLYTDRGITDRVRTDLTGPDGKPGFDISGYTMKRMYEEMSKGAYTVDGEATPWVTVDHSEGWYGTSRCFRNAEGEWEAPAPQAMTGHPDNPKGASQLPIDAVAALAEAQPDFPWADYDIEDQGDVDGDGDLQEPDGIIDHVVLVHAGKDKSGGGGAEGVNALWAHSSTVTSGGDVPGTDLKVSNYIVQPEDSGVGVFAHEYGHDLGLPDLYDTSGNADSDVDFWDLMSSGSHSGPIFQSMPTHMGIWDKWVLGWADVEEVNPGDDARDIKVGQTSRTPKGTEDGVKINLPTKVTTVAEPHSGENMWYGGNDQDWADVRLTRTVEVPDAADAKFWMWNDYVIEEDWDYGFVELSTDGGSTWTEQPVFDEAGDLVSTPDDYADPNGRLVDYGNKSSGLTGSTDGWRHDYIDLAAYAGQSVQVRLRYATDAAFLERGWFADDFSVTGGGETTWSDDVEGPDDNGWTNTVDTFTNTTGAGWHKDTGTSRASHYYLVEWRNYDGFDEGLKYAYDTTYSDGAWKVEKIRYNAPGALVWYRDTTWGNANHVTANNTALPSGGAKGGLLIVDSHYEPLRRSGANAALDGSTLKNLPSRGQSSNAAFGLVPTKQFQECQPTADLSGEACNTFGPQAPVKEFTDLVTWAPGLEERADGYYWRDIDASVVVPSRDNEPYTTRIVNPDGSPATYGLNFGFTVTGSGNPEDDGVGYGTSVKVRKTKKANQIAKLFVSPPAP